MPYKCDAVGWVSTDVMIMVHVIRVKINKIFLCKCLIVILLINRNKVTAHVSINVHF